MVTIFHMIAIVIVYHAVALLCGYGIATILLIFWALIISDS